MASVGHLVSSALLPCLMKRLPLLFAACLPGLAWAQQPMPTTEPVLPPIINPRILELATKSVLYRRLRDTASGRPARVLRPGDFVQIPNGYSRWIRVRRANGPSELSYDTATFYMPAAAFKGGRITIVR